MPMVEPKSSPELLIVIGDERLNVAALMPMPSGPSALTDPELSIVTALFRATVVA